MSWNPFTWRRERRAREEAAAQALRARTARETVERKRLVFPLIARSGETVTLPVVSSLSARRAVEQEKEQQRRQSTSDAPLYDNSGLLATQSVWSAPSPSHSCSSSDSSSSSGSNSSSSDSGSCGGGD